LRSGAEIDHMFRDALADAVENQSGTGASVILKHEAGTTAHMKAIAACHEWTTIGRWIEAQISDGCPYSDALERAARCFPAGDKKCEQALRYYRRVSRWVEAALTKPAGTALSTEMLEAIYHQAVEDRLGPKGPRDPAFKQMNAALLGELGLSQ
jgi:hypothetical protein